MPRIPLDTRIWVVSGWRGESFAGVVTTIFGDGYGILRDDGSREFVPMKWVRPL